MKMLEIIDFSFWLLKNCIDRHSWVWDSVLDPFLIAKIRFAKVNHFE